MSWAELRRSFFCSAIGSQPPSLHPIHTHMFLALLWDTHNTSSLFWRNNIAQVPEPPDFYLSVNEIASSYDKCQNANHPALFTRISKSAINLNWILSF